MKIDIKITKNTNDLKKQELLIKNDPDSHDSLINNLRQSYTENNHLKIAYLHDEPIGQYFTRKAKVTPLDLLAFEYFKSNNYLVLEHMNVLPNFRDMSVGAVLLNDFLSLPGNKVLFVAKKNRKSIQLYRQNGFSKCAKYKDPETHVVWYVMVYKEA